MPHHSHSMYTNAGSPAHLLLPYKYPVSEISPCPAGSTPADRFLLSPYLSTPHSNGTGCRLCCPVLPHCQGTFSKYFFDFLLYIIIQFIIPAAIPNLFYISPINIHTIQMMRIPIVA